MKLGWIYVIGIVAFCAGVIADRKWNTAMEGRRAKAADEQFEIRIRSLGPFYTNKIPVPFPKELHLEDSPLRRLAFWKGFALKFTYSDLDRNKPPREEAVGINKDDPFAIEYIDRVEGMKLADEARYRFGGSNRVELQSWIESNAPIALKKSDEMQTWWTNRMNVTK